MQNNLKNIKYYKCKKINKKKAHIVLIFIYIMIYLICNMITIYGLEEKDIIGETRVKLNQGEQKELVYTIDRKYILQIDKVRKNNANTAIIKTYTSESSPNKVFVEIKGMSKGTTEMNIYYNYTTTSRIVDKYSSIIKKVVVEVGNDVQNTSSSNNTNNNGNSNNIEGKVSETNIDRKNGGNNSLIGESNNQSNQPGDEKGKENLTIITSKEIDEIFNNIRDTQNKDETTKENNAESDIEREQKKEEDKKILENVEKDENLFKTMVLIGTIIALSVHIYKYIKFER